VALDAIKKQKPPVNRRPAYPVHPWPPVYDRPRRIPQSQ